MRRAVNYILSCTALVYFLQNSRWKAKEGMFARRWQDLRPNAILRKRIWKSSKLAAPTSASAKRLSRTGRVRAHPLRRRRRKEAARISSRRDASAFPQRVPASQSGGGAAGNQRARHRCHCRWRGFRNHKLNLQVMIWPNGIHGSPIKPSRSPPS